MDDNEDIRKGDIFFKKTKYKVAKRMYESAHNFQVNKYGTDDNEEIFVTRIKIAETCARLKQIREALRIYEDIRERAKKLGLQDITFFCKLELSSAISFKDFKELYISAEDYDRVERQFVYYEEMIETLCSAATFKEDSDRVKSIYNDMESNLGLENIIVLRMGRLIARMYSLMGIYLLSSEYYGIVYKKCLIFPGPNHPLTLLSCLDAARALRDLCDFENAFSVLNDHHKTHCPNFSKEDYAEATQKIMCQCGNIYYAEGRYTDAVEFYRLSSHYGKELHKPEDRLILHVERMMGNIYFKNGDCRTALQTLANVFQKQAECSGNRDMLLTICDMAEIMKEIREYDGAEKAFKTMCEMSISTQSDIIHAENEIAIILTKKHEVEEAVTKFKILMEKCNETSYPTRLLASIQNGLAMAYCEQGKYHDAIEIYEEIIKKKKEHLSFYHADILRMEYNLGRVDEKRNNLTEALNRFQRIRDLRRAIFHRAHPDCLSIETHIAEILEKQNVHEEAFRIYCDVYETIAYFYGTDCLKSSEVKVKMRITAEKIQSEPRLIIATKEDNLQGIRDCLERGDDVNRRDNTGLTPLHIACRKGSSKAVLMLLKFGANYEMQNWNSETPLAVTSSTVIRETLDQVRRLFQKVKNLEDEGVINIMKEVESNERLEAIFNAKDNRGYTPLHWVSSNMYTMYNNGLNKCILIVQLLLSGGADIKSATKEGYLALYLSAMAGNEAVFKMLCVYLARHYQGDFMRIINDKNNDKGSTLLHIAAVYNLAETVQTLLLYRAKPSVKNKLGKSPIDLTSNRKVRQLLFEGASFYDRN